MSAWRLVVQELHVAGGSKRVGRMHAPAAALEIARQMGLVARPGVRGRAAWTVPALLTPFGVDFAEGRVQKVDNRLGRRWQATWLAALPRANEVRLTGAVHRTQNDGTCYW